MVPYGVAAGDPTVVSVEVTNPGSVVGGETLALYVDGEQVDSTVARVPAESERQIDFPFDSSKGATTSSASVPRERDRYCRSRRRSSHRPTSSNGSSIASSPFPIKRRWTRRSSSRSMWRTPATN
ncbi:hypothetical protein [Halalkalicoccus salilacus]|uniref:hypothetical protein n=1 Tax=Halalkalicoccus sp. GCM10025704 TaxID=3252662 RepID=UPI003611FE29